MNGCRNDFTRVGATTRIINARSAVAAAASLMVALSGFAAVAQDDYDPLAKAIASLDQPIGNPEAVVPSQCYTKTEGISNPCWTCHTVSQGMNFMFDQELQAEYSFSDFALKNHWTNLFADRSAVIASISDQEALDYVRVDNYTPLAEHLAGRDDYPGWVPDLDYRQGFDAEGFANDGSWWRAITYKPFAGTFWPTNGSTDDVLIKLPAKFWKTAAGDDSRAAYKVNLAILEAAVTVAPGQPLERRVERVEEEVAGFDLNDDGVVGGVVEVIRALPEHYVGAAADEPVARWLYPTGTEFLHTVRYVDPDSPTLLSARMKEVRYMLKQQSLDLWGLLRAYELEHEEKAEGKLPVFAGSALTGLVNDFGWRIQGFIEDADGSLRLQTEEEHLFCMGCHSTVGVTVDQTFGFPRKVPGADGWGHQDLAGIKDVPQVGHADPEILEYFRRVKGGDEFRANTEVLERFFPDGVLDEEKVRQAAYGGSEDITYLIVPSRERALTLNKAYMALVRENSFELGRDAVAAPTENVHQTIVNGSTDLGASGLLFTDGVLWLDWDVDSDGDEVPDRSDNCILEPNLDQRDTSGDGYGNACDPDFDNDLVVGVKDLSSLKAVFGSADAPDHDLDGDGIVGAVDLSVFKARFGQAPGPSCCAGQ